MTVPFPTVFDPGFRTIDGTLLNQALGMPQFSTENGITALAGGGQTGATPLLASINRVTTVATAADSVALPAAIAGMAIMVVNDAASNSMQVFGAGSDTINGVAFGTGVAQAAGKTALYVCAIAGKWDRLLSA